MKHNIYRARQRRKERAEPREPAANVGKKAPPAAPNTPHPSWFNRKQRRLWRFNPHRLSLDVLDRMGQYETVYGPGSLR